MASDAQIAAIVALAELGQTEAQIAATVGVEIGDVASVMAGATFANPYIPKPGGSGGSLVVHKMPFTFDTGGSSAALAAGVLCAFTDGYVPQAGDILYDSRIQIDTAWNGTTPLCDAQFDGDAHGIFYLTNTVGPQSLLVADDDSAGVGGVTSNLLSGLTSGRESFNGASGAQATAAILPYTIIATIPLRLVVSQDGTTTGADPGSTQGAGVFYLVTARP